jgi:low affinity Fe/Cu permease
LPATSCANGRCSDRKPEAFVIDDLQVELIVGSWFQRVTTVLARFIGRPVMLLICLALAALSCWSFFRGGDSLVSGTNLAINVLTLLFLPILQATQNRDGAALQAKLDELIKASQGARNDFIGLEQRDEEEIEELRPVPGNVTDPHPEEEPVA